MPVIKGGREGEKRREEEKSQGAHTAVILPWVQGRRCYTMIPQNNLKIEKSEN